VLERRRLRASVALASGLLLAAWAGAAGTDQDETGLAAAWLKSLAGEYSNNEQVWQQGLDDEELFPRWHFTFSSPEESAASWRWRLEVAEIQNGEFTGATWGWNLAVVAGAGQADALPELEDHCRYQLVEAALVLLPGEVGRRGCPQAAASGPPRRIALEGERALLDFAAPGASTDRHIARRAARYRGWIVLQRRILEPDAAEDDYLRLGQLDIHNEGQMVPFLTGDGNRSGYSVELARLTYQASQIPILKLGIVEDASGKTLAYSWAGPNAARIGINLRWIQAGFTRSAPAVP